MSKKDKILPKTNLKKKSQKISTPEHEDVHTSEESDSSKEASEIFTVDDSDHGESDEGKPNKNGKERKYEKTEKSEKSEKLGKSEKSEKSEKAEKLGKSEKSEKAVQSEKVENDEKEEKEESDEEGIDSEESDDRSKLINFRLPKGFKVKEKTRQTGRTAGRKDLYYHAPDGAIFRSIASVQRYVQYGTIEPKKKRKKPPLELVPPIPLLPHAWQQQNLQTLKHQPVQVFRR